MTWQKIHLGLPLSILVLAIAGCTGDNAEIPTQRRCIVEVNGQVVKTIETDNRNDCYAETSFGSSNCEVYAEHFKPGDNQLRQVFGAGSVVNQQTCTLPDE